MIEAVIGEAASEGVEVVMTLPKSGQEAGEIVNVDVRCSSKFVDPRGKIGTSNPERLVGPECREDFCRES